MKTPTTVALVGVGGQGILLGAAVLAQTAAAAGYDVKASEVKGMSQRGGSVVSSVRFGEQVWSPVSPQADLVIAIEVLEGRRALDLLSAGGTLICAITTRIAPGSVVRRQAAYPDDIAEAAREKGVRLVPVEADELARAAGDERAANVVLLGASSHVLPFSAEAWQQGLATAVPKKILALNQRAFALGRDTVLEEV